MKDKTNLKKKLFNLIFSLILLLSLNSCLVLSNTPEIIYPKQDSEDFLKNHASKNKKVYVDIKVN